MIATRVQKQSSNKFGVRERSWPNSLFFFANARTYVAGARRGYLYDRRENRQNLSNAFIPGLVIFLFFFINLYTIRLEIKNGEDERTCFEFIVTEHVPFKGCQL